MIKAIPQRNGNDCAFATVAMAANTTYDKVYDAARAHIYRAGMGLTPDEQRQLLELVTGKPWDLWDAPRRSLLTGFDITVARDRETEDDDARIILSTYAKKGRNLFYRHSIFTDGFRIFDPWLGYWLPFSKVRRMSRYRRMYIQGMLCERGMFSG